MTNIVIPYEIVQMIECRRASLDYLWIAELLEMGNLTNEQIIYYLKGMSKRAIDDHDKMQKMYAQKNAQKAAQMLTPEETLK